jgi:mRNA interferase MazF
MRSAPPTSARPLARGDIVLVTFPFTDLSSTKRRPAVVLWADPAQTDFTLAFVSSQHVTSLSSGETALLPTHPEFALSGLSVPSKIRAMKLVTLNRTLITRWLGRLGTLWIADLDRALVAALGVNTVPYRDEGRQEERRRLAALYAAGSEENVLADLGLTRRAR